MTPMTRRNGVKLNYYLTTGFCSYKIFELLSTFSKKITFKVCFLNCFRHYQKKSPLKFVFVGTKKRMLERFQLTIKGSHLLNHTLFLYLLV